MNVRELNPTILTRLGWALTMILLTGVLAAADAVASDVGVDDSVTQQSGAALPATPDHPAEALDLPKALAGCSVFPPDHIWNVPVDTLPRDARSDDYVATIGATRTMHADFGSGLWDGGPIGIPYVAVPGDQAKVPVTFDYDDQSDPGPYPVPPNAPIEGGANSDGDRHVLVVDRERCVLYELFYAYPQQNGSWTAGSGAVYDLKGYGLRPAGWTSADAAGLPILPGLVRYEEVAAGAIRHAIRFTAPETQRAYVWPARHYASDITDAKYPPMGQRFRLKASYDISSFGPQSQVVLKALKKYGMILADNGSSWYISGSPNELWDNDDLHELGQVPGSAFEAVDVSSLMISPNSGRANVKVAVANFSAGPARGKAPLRVKFTDKSRGDVVSWLWKFGDGRRSHKQHPTHVYKKPGHYTVTLRVTGAAEQGTSVKIKKGCITVKAP
jgi:hypothetical protein